MKNKLLYPDQIITLRDFPLYNEQILKIYFRVFSKNQGRILPPCPVLHKSSGIPYSAGGSPISKRYNTLLERFLEEHPHAEYFLLDGSHKTTAAALARKPAPALIMERDGDFKEAMNLVRTGEIFGWHDVDKSIADAIKTLAKHHLRTKAFLTAEEKTRAMVEKGDLPEYMISFYRKN